MRAVIVYESMFGNTHAIADAIGKGLEPVDNMVVVPVVEAGHDRLGDADLLVAGRLEQPLTGSAPLSWPTHRPGVGGE